MAQVAPVIDEVKESSHYQNPKRVVKSMQQASTTAGSSGAADAPSALRSTGPSKQLMSPIRNQ